MTQMRAIAFGFALGTLTSAGIATAGYVPPLRAATQLIADAAQANAEIDRTASLVRDATLRTRLVEQSYRVQMSLDGLQRVVHSIDGPARPHRPHVDPPVVVEPVQPQVVVCNDATFARVVAAVQDASFASDKKAVVSSALADQWVTTHQVGTLLDLFSFGSDQVEVAASLFPNTIDPENWFQLYSKLSFSSDRDALRARTR